MFIFKPLVSIAALGSILAFSAMSDALPAHSRDLSTRSKKAPVKPRMCAVKGLKPGSPPKGAKKLKRDEIFARNGPSATKALKLYHGTSTADALRFGALRLSEAAGDFSDDGGFYLTDKLEHAGQYFCQGKEVVPKPTEVAIIEFAWNPTAHAGKILEWSSNTEAKSGHTFTNFCGINNSNDVYTERPATNKDLKKWRDALIKDIDMVTGPMTLEEDTCLAADFWQYAVIKESALASLTKGTVHTKPCSEFPARS